jgi:hypothetical protein
VGDGAVAAADAVDMVVLGGIMRPMLAVDHSVLFRRRRRQGQPSRPCDGLPTTFGSAEADRTDDNDAWARAGERH